MSNPNYILIAKGRKHLTFKATHSNYHYLEEIGALILKQPKSSYLRYDIFETENATLALTSA
ncbi:hypothetical protein [Thiomicrorhabdus xiamenensis]|uniref:Uncharacterized protein n=1 Tax=Thiomicrorhabdus xiamenensis TaxID=2739063 RepID=A0A7D4T241_9GAMM|nr:hypothetical protein [Thiomicrorhabdus xiamenensis]QKI90085.1 hypothetical protein HQN79_11115 [Thiomicrorhabdus xiamenensis]